MHNPENIHLVTHELRLGLFHQQIEERFVAVRLKFVAVSVIEEFDAMLRKHFTGMIENRSGFAARLLVEVTLVWYPRATRIFQSQRFGFFSNAFRIIAIFFERKMPAYGFNPALSQLGFEFF